MNNLPRDRASQHGARVTIDISWLGFPPSSAEVRPFSNPQIDAVAAVGIITHHFSLANVLATGSSTEVNRDGRQLQFRVPPGPYAELDKPKIRKAYEAATQELGTPRTLDFTGNSGSPVPVVSRRGPSDLLGSFLRWLASIFKNDD